MDRNTQLRYITWRLILVPPKSCSFRPEAAKNAAKDATGPASTSGRAQRPAQFGGALLVAPRVALRAAPRRPRAAPRPNTALTLALRNSWLRTGPLEREDSFALAASLCSVKCLPSCALHSAKRELWRRADPPPPHTHTHTHTNLPANGNIAEEGKI